jgi:cell division FtsZ-interacting protein ZapD
MTKKCTKHSAARLQSVLIEYDALKKSYKELLVKFNHHTEIIAKQDELIQAQSDYIKTRDKLKETEALYMNTTKRDDLRAALLKQIQAFPRKQRDASSKDLICFNTRDDLHAAVLKQIKSFHRKKHDVNGVNGVNRRQMDVLLQELKEYYSKQILKDVNEPIIVDETYIKTEAIPVNTASYPSRKACIVM